MQTEPIKIEITVFAASKEEAVNIQNKLQNATNGLGRLGTIGLLESADEYLSKVAKLALQGKAIKYKFQEYGG